MDDLITAEIVLTPYCYLLVFHNIVQCALLRGRTGELVNVQSEHSIFLQYPLGGLSIPNNLHLLDIAISDTPKFFAT